MDLNLELLLQSLVQVVLRFAIGQETTSLGS